LRFLPFNPEALQMRLSRTALYALALTGMVAAAAGCQQNPAVVSQAITAKTAGPSYVYVADNAQKALLVYRFGVPSAPVDVVRLGDAPQGVAADSKGNVYVSLFNSSTVRMYSAGAKQLLQTISAGLYKPTGVAIDTADNLYVGNHCQGSGCQAGVLEFHPGAAAAFRSIADVSAFGVEGVAVDSVGNVWMDSFNGPGGYGFRFVNGQRDSAVTLHLVSSDGIAVNPAGTVYAASAGAVMSFPPNSLKGVGTEFRGYGVGHAVRLIGTGPNGILAIPVQASAQDGGPFVDIIAGSASYRITKGLSSPFGAAVGT
jgi:hypothetical protein